MCMERSRREKIKMISDLIIGVCIDKEELKNSGEKYFSRDNSLAIDVCMVLNKYMDYAGTKLKCKLSDTSGIPSAVLSEASPSDAT